MPTKKIVVVVNRDDLDDVSKACLDAGLKEEDIYFSKNPDATTLEKMGININLPVGQLYIRSNDSVEKSEKDYPVIIIYQ